MHLLATIWEGGGCTFVAESKCIALLYYKQNNDRFKKNLSDTPLTADHNKTLLSKGLNSHILPQNRAHKEKSNQRFPSNNFTSDMCLKFLFADCNSKPHQLHVKSNWQLPPQPSVALENYLESTKYDIATISFCNSQDNPLAKRTRSSYKASHKHEGEHQKCQQREHHSCYGYSEKNHRGQW